MAMAAPPIQAPSEIPVIDFAYASRYPDEAAKLLLRACEEWGFFHVRNHTIPQEAIDGIFELEKRFFAQSDEAKSIVRYDQTTNAGFKPASSYSASRKLTDPREAFSINKWPTTFHASTASLSPTLDEARNQISEFQAYCLSFTARLLELIALALEMPKNQFSCLHNQSASNFDNFELMHYPPVSLTSSKDQAFRISPHTDWGTLTLLFQQNIGGLEVRPPTYTSSDLDFENESWTEAPASNDTILVNIADMLEFWTAGRLKSTWHRVVPTPEHAGVDRYTFAYFLHPNKDAVLTPIQGLHKKGWVPRYEGVGRTAEQHIRARIAKVHGGNSEAARTPTGDVKEMVNKEILVTS